MRKSVAVYGNCNLSAFWGLLGTFYADAYEYNYVSFELFAAETPLPESIWNADILIYQPTTLKGYESAPIAKRFQEQSKPCLSVPIPLFEGYHPDYASDPLNLATKSPTRPWGRFPYGMQGVMNLRGSMPIPEIIAQTKKDDFVPVDYAQRRAELSLALLRRAEAGCDIQLGDWIEANYQQQFLFHSIGHPTNLLLQRLYDPIFEFLKLPKIDLSHAPELLRSCSPPIYPGILKTLQLAATPAPALDSQTISYDQYITEYASLATDDSICKATLVWSELPSQLPIASACKVSICLRNDSVTIWHASPPGSPEVKVSYHWMQGWQHYSFDNIRTRLPHDVSPGESVVIEMDLHTPDEPGRFTLAWDCVIEFVCWFSYRGLALPRSSVEIA